MTPQQAFDTCHQMGGQPAAIKSAEQMEEFKEAVRLAGEQNLDPKLPDGTLDDKVAAGQPYRTWIGARRAYHDMFFSFYWVADGTTVPDTHGFWEGWPDTCGTEGAKLGGVTSSSNCSSEQHCIDQVRNCKGELKEPCSQDCYGDNWATDTVGAGNPHAHLQLGEAAQPSSSYSNWGESNALSWDRDGNRVMIPRTPTNKSGFEFVFQDTDGTWHDAPDVGYPIIDYLNYPIVGCDHEHYCPGRDACAPEATTGCSGHLPGEPIQNYNENCTAGRNWGCINGFDKTGMAYEVNASFCKAQLGSTIYNGKPVVATDFSLDRGSVHGSHAICNCHGRCKPGTAAFDSVPKLGACRIFYDDPNSPIWDGERYSSCTGPDHEIWALGAHPNYLAWAGCQGICPPSAPPPDPPSPPPSPPSLPCQPVVLTFFNPSGEWEGLEVAFDGVEPNASDYVAGSMEMTYSVCRIPGCYELTIGGVVPDQINWYAFVFDEIVRSLPRYHSAPAS